MMLYRRGEVYHYKFEHEGRRYRGTTRMTDEHKAAIVAAKKQQAVLEGSAGLTKTKVLLLSVHLKEYLRWARTDHPATVDARDTKVLEYFLATVGDKRLDQYAPFDVERWRSERGRCISKGKPIGKSTLDRELNCIRGCFTKAVEWRLLKVSPFAGVRNLVTSAGQLTKFRTLTDVERAIVLQKLPHRFALMCRVTLECLPRINEVLHISRNDLKVHGLQRKLKGGKVATVAVTPELLADLRAELQPGQQYVFGDLPTLDTNYSKAVSSYFTRLFRDLGLEGISHHTMRHTGVTDMLDAGINPRVIQQLAGWSSLRMLERYGHTRDREMLRAVKATAALNRAALTRKISPADLDHGGGVPGGNRTRVSSLKGSRPGPLDDRDR